MTDKLTELVESIRNIPLAEKMPFKCPKCGGNVWMPSLAFIQFGPPNVHADCGYSGADMQVAK